MIALGVPAGAIKPNEPLFSKPFRPLSSRVGTPGSSVERVRLVTPRARALPDFT